MDYDTYLKKCADIKELNNSLLELFSDDLKKLVLLTKQSSAIFPMSIFISTNICSAQMPCLWNPA